MHEYIIYMQELYCACVADCATVIAAGKEMDGPPLWAVKQDNSVFLQIIVDFVIS